MIVPVLLICIIIGLVTVCWRLLSLAQSLKAQLHLYTSVESRYPVGLIILNDTLELRHINSYMRRRIQVPKGTLLSQHLDLGTLRDCVQRGDAKQTITLHNAPYQLAMKPIAIRNDTFYCLFLTPIDENEPVTIDEEDEPFREAVRTMALGLAHELKNPITAIKMLLQMPSDPTNPETLEKTQTILSYEIERLDKTIGDFLHYAEVGPLKFEQIKPDALVEEVEMLLRKQRPDTQLPIKNSFFPVPYIPVDKSKMIQVLLNIIQNALDAIPEHGGHIEIHTRKVAPYVVIQIIDNGPGIPDELKNKIFLPFFTTKKDGLGLGLSLAEKIIQEHLGYISCESGDGKSTTFTIMLPIKHEIDKSEVSLLPKQEVILNSTQ